MKRSQFFGLPSYPPEVPGAEHVVKPELTPDSDSVNAMTAALEAALQSLRNRPKTFHVITVSVPAGALNFGVNLPDRYDWLTLFFAATTPAGFRFGPEGSSILIEVFSGTLIIPGTSNHYTADNPGAAAYEFQIFGMRGFGPAYVNEFI